MGNGAGILESPLGGYETMATTDELQKREKSRRVWRLNKREGVPVLEALDAVGISKDVYYRVKNQYEEKWENEIVTAEGLEEKLEELDRRADELEEKIEERDDDVSSVYGKIQNIRAEEQFYDRVKRMEEEMIAVKNLLQDTDIDLSQVEGDKKERRERSEIEELREYLKELNKQTNKLYKQMKEIEDKQEELEGKVRSVRTAQPNNKEESGGWSPF